MFTIQTGIFHLPKKGDSDMFHTHPSFNNPHISDIYNKEHWTKYVKSWYSRQKTDTKKEQKRNNPVWLFHPVVCLSLLQHHKHSDLITVASYVCRSSLFTLLYSLFDSVIILYQMRVFQSLKSSCWDVKHLYVAVSSPSLTSFNLLVNGKP